MATNVDTSITVAARKGQIFTMSDGNLVAVYYNGTAWGYRVKASGTWGSRTALTSSPASTGACWAQDGDNLFGAVSGSGVSFYVYKLAYNAATDAITQTNTLTGDNVPVLAVYLDTTNARFNVVAQITSAGVYLYSFATSNLANGITATAISAGSPPATGQDDTTWAAVGAGSGTWQLAWFTTAGGTAFNVVTMVTTTTAITSQTAETSVPALAANCTGLDAAYDGTNITFTANQNNAALRVTRRTAANTYDTWSTLVTETIAGKPSLARKTGGSDLMVAYRSNAAQANGEIATFKRLSGTWDASKMTLAGGASTGWGNPVLAPTDLNQGTAGTVPVVYLTGTANPWTLVEDSAVIGSGATSWSQPINDTATISDTIAVSGALALSDTITGTDQVSKALARTIADNLTVTDSGTAVDAATTIADAATVADQATSATGFARTVADTPSIVDTIDTGGSMARTQQIDDTATATDALARDIARPIADTATSTDAASNGLGRAVSDTLTASDQAATVWDAVRQVADTATVGDSINTGATTDHARQIDDTLTASDTRSSNWAAAFGLDDTLTVAEALAHTSAYARTVTDLLTVTEDIDGIPADTSGYTYTLDDTLPYTYTLR